VSSLAGLRPWMRVVVQPASLRANRENEPEMNNCVAICSNAVE